MDVFIEKLITKRKSIEDYLFSFGVVIGIFILSMLARMYVPRLWLFVLVGGIYGGFYLISGRNVEYEYILTNDDLDIDKIISQRKRVRVFSGSLKECEIMAKATSEQFRQEYKNIKTVIKAVSGGKAENEYFAVTKYKGERVLLYFEPDERVLKAVKIHLQRKLLIG